MKITFIVGLPGSGKTYFGNQLLDLRGGVFLDDISTLNQIKGSIGQDIIISDVFLCREKERDKATRIINKIALKVGFQYDIEWVFFENNPAQCLKNVEYREKQGDKRRVTDFINAMSLEYTIPTDAPQWKVWCNYGQ